TGKVIRRYTAGKASNELKSNFTLCLLQTNNKEIFIGTNNGFFKYHPRSDDFEQPTTLPEHLFVTSIFQDHTGSLWVAAHTDGLYLYNPLNGQASRWLNDPDNKNSITNNNINAVCEDSRQNVWISTE